MPKQKLIEDMKSKREKFARESRMTSDPDRMLYIEGELHILDYYIKELESGTFDPTPPVQPDRFFAVSVKDEGFHLTSDEGEEVKYIIIGYNGKMEGYSDDMKEIEMIYGKVTRLTGEVITND